jgi:putative membrane protein
MFAAALVLFLSSPDKRGAAVKQGAFPLLAIVLLILGIAL